jgi:hypothetical protein
MTIEPTATLAEWSFIGEINKERIINYRIAATETGVTCNPAAVNHVVTRHMEEEH